MNSKYHSPSTSMVKLRSEGAMLADSTQVTSGYVDINSDLPDIQMANTTFDSGNSGWTISW